MKLSIAGIILGKAIVMAGALVQAMELPDPLVTANGDAVTTTDQWRDVRRPETLELFRKHIYGRNPVERPENLSFEITQTDNTAMGGMATLKRIDIHYAGLNGEGKMELIVFIPNNLTRPAPGFLLICNRSRDNMDPTRTKKSAFWPAERIVQRGYVAAVFHNSDLAPDAPNMFHLGVHGIFEEQNTVRAPDAWGAVAAWAWGASRAMDYFETDEDIDAKRIAVVGHSRGGKAALWCGAQDERFALVVSNNSGETGAALARRKVGERIADINANSHWFCANYKKFNGKEDDLPVDQHQLLALMAPRPVYVASATLDDWADPLGEFLSCVHAEPVYQLYGLNGMGTDEFPQPGQSLHTGHIAYHLREGIHDLTEYDWDRYMDFADLNRSTVYNWPAASGIVFGQSLSESTLRGGLASIEGTFAFDSPATTPDAGSHTAAVTFTPLDAAYSSVSGSVTVAVDKATPVVSDWPVASAITYGQYFNVSVLSGGSAPVPGGFAFNDPAALVDGHDSFAFRVSDGESNSAPATVSITVGGPQGAPEAQAFEPNASRLWTPADITSLAWYDAADATTITVEGGAVSQWNDKSGNARHVSQGTSGRRPTVSGSTIAFDGTDDFLTRSGAFCYAAGSADFYVVAAATNANARIVSENRSSADNPMYGFRISTTETRMGAYVRSDDGSELFNNTMSATNVFSRQTPNLYLWRDTGSNLSGRIAGGSATSVGYSRSGKAMTLDQFSIGATGPRPNAPSGLTFVNAGMNEIVITANLGDADRQKMEGYLAWKWNLLANLPAGHPYKEAAPAVITNNDPVAYAQSVAVQPGAPTAITLTGSDPDDDSLTFEIVTQPTHGALSGTPPNVIYTPPALPAVGMHQVTVVFTPADTANYHSVSGTVGVTVSGGSVYQNWAGQYPDHDLSDPQGDSDGDGVSNFHEFAFGLDPTNGSSSNPIVSPFDKASRSFSYTRRAGSGLAYTVCVSPDLRDWQDLPPAQVAESIVESTEPGAETVTVTLSSLPDAENLFLRVKAH